MDGGRVSIDARPQIDAAVSPVDTPAVSSTAPVPNLSVPTAPRRSKWDEAPPDAGASAELKVPPRPNQHVLKLDAVQIRALIGKGGETIKSLRSQLSAGSDIRIEHVHTEMEGTVTIIGEIERAQRIITDCLASKGCPFMPGVAGVLPKNVGMMSSFGGSVGAVYGGEAHPTESLFDVQIPQELVGMLIGPGGSHLKDVRAKAGDNVSISVLPPSFPMAPQIVRVEGENQESRKIASDLIRERIMVLKQTNPQGRIPTMPFRTAPPGSLPHGLTPAAALLEGGALTRSLPRPPPAQPQALGKAHPQMQTGGFNARVMPGPRPPPAISGLAPLPPPPGPPPLPVRGNTSIGQHGIAQPLATGPIGGHQPMTAQQAAFPSAAPPGLGDEDWLVRAARQAAEKLQDKQPLPRSTQMMQPFPQMPLFQQPNPVPAQDLQAAGMQGLAALVAAQNGTL